MPRPFKNKLFPDFWCLVLVFLLVTDLAGFVPARPAAADSGYTLPPSTQLRAIAYGNGAYVVAGGYYDTSVTPGTSSAMFLTSPDGSTWTVQPAMNNIGIVGIAFGNGIFVAVGSMSGKTQTSGVVLTSGDGAHWTENSFDVEFTNVVYGNGTFVLIGYNDNYTSTDGVNWTPISKQYANALYEYSQLIYTGSVFADFKETQFASSQNGTVWQTEDMGVIDWSKYLNVFPDIGVTGAVYGDSRYVAVGTYYPNTQAGRNSYPIVITSPDGVKWTTTKLAASCQLEQIAFGNGIFVATGLDGSIPTSPDGLTWTVRDTGAEAAYGVVSFCNNEFAALGDGGAIATSPDGVHWTNSSSAYQAVFTVGQSNYILNGQTYSTDAAPFINNGRVFVPVRYLGEALGVDVGWNGDPNDKTVQLNDNRTFTDKGGVAGYPDDRQPDDYLSGQHYPWRHHHQDHGCGPADQQWPYLPAGPLRGGGFRIHAGLGCRRPDGDHPVAAG